jgi:hypothetical protein
VRGYHVGGLLHLISSGRLAEVAPGEIKIQRSSNGAFEGPLGPGETRRIETWTRQPDHRGLPNWKLTSSADAASAPSQDAAPKPRTKP